jgi:hypothetical protein
MFKTSIILAFGLTLASLVSARDTGSASINSVDYGAEQPKTASPAPQPASQTEPAVHSADGFTSEQETPIRERPVASIPANIREELESKTDDYYSAKHQAIGFGIAAIVLDVAATVVGLQNTTTTTDEYGYQTTSTPPASYFILLAAGGACEVFSVVRTINAIVRGAQLRSYENETGYRLSLKPLVLPRTGQMGAVASVSF